MSTQPAPKRELSVIEGGGQGLAQARQLVETADVGDPLGALFRFRAAVNTVARHTAREVREGVHWLDDIDRIATQRSTDAQELRSAVDWLRQFSDAAPMEAAQLIEDILERADDLAQLESAMRFAAAWAEGGEG